MISQFVLLIGIRAFKFYFKFNYYGLHSDIIENLLEIKKWLVKIIVCFLQIFIICHVFGCLWVLTARMSGFSPDTWPVRLDFLNESPDLLYLQALYFAFVSLLTVGYGDINCFSTSKTLLI